VAISHDAISSSSATGTGVSWSHTIGSAASDRVLYVGLMLETGGSSPTASFGGVSLGAAIASASNGWASTHVWRVIAPSTGAGTVAFTWTGSAYAVAGAISKYGVHQTTPNGLRQRHGVERHGQFRQR
jgi:hypothetical protein